MAATQLSFALRTTSNVKTVHLIGSWDGYQGQIPLSRSSSKSGSWSGSFRFQSTVLVPGRRYWFYYMLDGYKVSHDPARDHTTEPTTGRKLNILNVPAAAATVEDKRAARRHSRAIPLGRSISPSAIKCPQPQRRAQASNLVSSKQAQATLEALTRRFAQQSLRYDDSDDDSEIEDDSDNDSDCSDVPSLSSGSSRSSCSSPSSVTSSCSCQRYGITRDGSRVKLDCGGSRCGSDDSDCSDFEENAPKYRISSTRRHGVVIA